MTKIYSLNGYRISEDDDTEENVGFAPVTLSFTFPSSVTEVSYDEENFVFPPGSAGAIPETDRFITMTPAPVFLAIDGVSVDQIHPSLGYLFEFSQLTQAAGVSYLFGFYFDDSLSGIPQDGDLSHDYIFSAAGVPLPELASYAEYIAFAEGFGGDPTVTATGAFAPGQAIPLSAFDWDSELIISDPVARTGTEAADTYVGGLAADTLDGAGGDDTLLAGEGDDALTGGPGQDRLVGGEGTDRAVFSGDQTSYTVTLTPTQTTIRDRRDMGDGIDILEDVELLDFANELPIFTEGAMNLDTFDGPAGLSAADFTAITELYIAYFNRAPDAIGLYFWGSAFADGLTLDEMAASFFDQVETRATYADALNADGTAVTDTSAFVTAVYTNVLGRDFDEAGRTFWTGVLDRSEETPAGFIQAIIEGAKAQAEPGSDADFIAQKAADVAYLGTKVDIGSYYAVIKGMSDVEDAQAVMALYDGSTESTDAAVAAIDGFFEAADAAETGDFLMPLVGVIADPFG